MIWFINGLFLIPGYQFKKMFSWLLLLLLSTFSASSTIRTKPKCSSNTSTFLVKSVNTRVESLKEVRDSKPHEYFINVPVNHQHQVKPSYNPNRAPLKNLRNFLLESLEEEDYDALLSILDEMYDGYPSIDHVNHLYDDEKNGGVKTLLHFAVASSNKELIYNLYSKYDLDFEQKDSYNYNALELAENLGLFDVILFLLKRIDGMALIPFYDFETYIHYAAATDREDLLRIIRKTNYYNFEKPIPVTRTSPLEFALFKESYAAADYLIKYDAYIDENAFLLCYSRALDKLKLDPNPAIFILSRFPYIIYWKNSSGYDIMLLAIKDDLFAVVEYLFKFGYDFRRVDYNLCAEAAHLNESIEIFNLVLSEIASKNEISK